MASEHRHDHEHRSLWLAPRAVHRPVYRVGRRQFLADLGRNTFAIAVLGGVVAACSGDDDDAGSPSETNEGDAGTEATEAAPGERTTPPGVAEAGRLRWAQADLGFVSAYVLVRGNEAVVVDTGQSGSVGQIGEALATLGASYDDVRHVVLTHSHPDHVGSLPGVLDAAAGATPYAGAADIPNISSPVDVVSVADGDEVLGLQVISTPGHTPGSISLLDPGIGLLVAGDALTGDPSGTTVLGPNADFTADMATAAASVRKLAGREIEIVAPGHGRPVDTEPGSSIGAIVDDFVESGLLRGEASTEGSSG